jgi:hypothetical protein
LREVCLRHALLEKLGQDFYNTLWQRHSVVPPSPNCHLGNAEETSRRAIAAEYRREHAIVPTGKRPALEARPPRY